MGIFACEVGVVTIKVGDSALELDPITIRLRDLS